MTGLIVTSLLFAGPPPRHDGAQLLNDLRRVSVLGTVLYVAAHPDDENTRLLASFANEAKYRTAYLSFTRGEGGQNLIGAELGPLLGVIRTQELLAARRLDGAEQYFTRARDFGYSKSVDETLATWDHDRVLADAVWLIRTLRPDLIVTRFSPEPTGTHGHHTASARLALEAFRAAADPAFHPEQLQTTPGPWQARRIVWNAWSPDPKVKLPDDLVQWDSSQYSPLLGLSYGELAAESRSMHKSQGFGAAPIHDGNVEHFAHLAGELAKKSIFEGIDASWKRVPGSEAFSGALDQAIAEFKVDAPARSIPALVRALGELRRLPENPWKAQKEQELVDVIAGCAGLFVEASAAAPGVVPGGKLALKVFVLNRSSAALRLDEVKVLGVSTAPATALEEGKAFKADLALDVPATLPASTPYYLEQPPTPGSWTLEPGHPVAAPELPSPFLVEYRFTAGAQAFTLRRPAYFKWTDPTAGERYRPIEVLPPVVLKPGAELLAFTDGAAKPLRVTVTAHAEAQRGEVRLELPPGYASEPAAAPFVLEKPGQQVELDFKVKPQRKDAPALATLTAVATVEGAAHARSLTRIEYPHIPIQTVLAPAQVKLMRVELKRGKTTRVGYVVGAGDDVPAALRQVGYDVTLLSDEALRSEPLGRYHAIVLGVRAWNVKPGLPAVAPRLWDYVKNGGTLVTQYNTKNWISSVPAQLGPYPFELGQDRVTDETAAVTTTPHAVLRAPNALGDADFSGWVQERGLYFAGTWDPRYETPLAMNDPNEKPAKGGLLVARVGKGRFVYTGLAFFRQLPAGVPGAYRLFANLLDHGS
jgi:LmbE family N-acetylglucosaminyl deacetylase